MGAMGFSDFHRSQCVNLRPGLGELSFPVGRVGKKTASRNFFFFLNIIVHKLECTGEKGLKKEEKMKI